MNTSPSSSPESDLPGQSGPLVYLDDSRLEPWLRLRSELAELHARLECLRLMMVLGVRRVD